MGHVDEGDLRHQSRNMGMQVNESFPIIAFFILNLMWSQASIGVSLLYNANFKSLIDASNFCQTRPMVLLQAILTTCEITQCCDLDIRC